MKRTDPWEAFFPILFLLLLSVSPSSYSLRMISVLNEVDDLCYCKDSQFPVLSRPVYLTNDKMQMKNTYYENISWVDSTIIINESTSFNSFSNLFIENSTIILSPRNPSDHIKVIIGESSLFNISNSILLVDGSTGGGGSLEFYGDTLSIINSSFIGLGSNDYLPGFYVINSQISITDSEFLLGYIGITFQDSQDVAIVNCSFRDITGIEGYGGIGILGHNSVRVVVSGCTFNTTNFGLYLQNCRHISVIKSTFTQCGSFAMYLLPYFYYYDVFDVRIENNTVTDSNFGVLVIGSEINIVKNSFKDLSQTGVYIAGRGINVSFNIFERLSRGVVSLESLGNPAGDLLSSISNTRIQRNLFENITLTGILLQNYDFPTIFYIIENNFTHNDIGLRFRGNLGGADSTQRSWVVGNIFDNMTKYAIQGISLDYLAHFQYTSFVGNVFVNSPNQYTSFQSKYYYMDDVRWDDGFLGNYWESFLNNSQCLDEDNNRIGDNSYILSVDHGQLDRAPLLSLDFFRKNSFLCSTHPVDLVRTKSELKRENNTLYWSIQGENGSYVVVLLNGIQITAEQNGSDVIVSLKSLEIGLYNLSLVIRHGSRLYRDLVWVRILKDENNFVTDILIPFGTLMFLIAIGIVIIFHIKRRNKSIF
ncbi:MAG: hypothetical protein ACFFB5_06135 [Promethearchaeota archaeon]